MDCKISKKSACVNCHKSGLAILPVRYSVVPMGVAASLPGSLGNKVTDVKLTHHKYALRTLRQGYLYLFHEKHPRGSQVKWEVYSVSPFGTLWKQISINSINPVNDEPCCSREDGHNIQTSFIAIEKPEKCGKIWIAFSEHAWSEETFKNFEENAALRDKRMQTFLPAVWIKAKGYRHGLEATQRNLENVLEYQDSFNATSLAGGKLVDNISKEDGTYNVDILKKETTCHPLHMRKAESKKVSDLMREIGKKSDGEDNTPIVIALWDAVGITHELNGFRNDTAGWIEKYNLEREFQISAMTSINGLKKTMGERAKNSVDAVANRMNQIPEHDLDAKTTRARILYRDRPAELNVELKKIQLERADRTARRNKAQSEKKNKDVVASWLKYKEKLDGNGKYFEDFELNHSAFFAAAGKLIEERTDSNIAWLESKNLLNALSEFHVDNIEDGENFEQTVGNIIMGITSCKNGVQKIVEWIEEAKATESNLLWRAIALNQAKCIVELDSTLSAAEASKDIPFSEVALNTALGSLKHVAKFADLTKKSLTLHNTLRKAGVIRVPTGGLEKIFMTVGDRFFQPYIKKGADLLSQKFVQSLLLVRAGCQYVKILDLLAAEAKFIANAEIKVLLAASAGHAIVSSNMKSLNNAWQKLIPEADIPKVNDDPKLAGAFNEAKELKFAMVATILQALFVWKLSYDAEKDKNNEKIQAELTAAWYSLGAGLIDLGATVIKGLHAAKDSAISFQILKLSGGILSVSAAWIYVGLDLKTAKKERDSQHYALSFLYNAKAFSNIVSGGFTALATLSYAKPATEMIARRFSSSVVARGVAYGFGRMFAWRAILMLGGLYFGVAVVGIQIAIWIFSDDDLQKWCEQCAFGIDKKNIFTHTAIQLSSFNAALKEVR